MEDLDKLEMHPKHKTQFQWLSLPSIAAIAFVALTKGYDSVGYLLSYFFVWVIYCIGWYALYVFSDIKKSDKNKKFYYFSLFIYQTLFIALCLIYVLYI